MLPTKHVILILIVFGLIIWFIINIKSTEQFKTQEQPPVTCLPLERRKNLANITNIANLVNPENIANIDKYRNKKFKLKKYRDKEPCPRPVQSIKDFHKDFFNFRDYTNENTSIVMDPVDRINKVMLEDDLHNVKIKDVFDKITESTDLYQQPRTRVHQFDNILYDNYDTSVVSGMQNVRKEWKYSGESTNNGKIVEHEDPYDPSDTKNFPVC